MHVTDVGGLDYLGGDVSSRASRSLDLLRVIDKTISNLCYDRSYYEFAAKFAHQASGMIKQSKNKSPIDPEGTIEEALQQAQDSMLRLYNAIIAKRKAAEADSRLTEDDGVAAEYTATIAVVADLHNGLNELRWVIGEHDADFAPQGKSIVLKTPEEIEAYLAN